MHRRIEVARAPRSDMRSVLAIMGASSCCSLLGRDLPRALRHGARASWCWRSWRLLGDRREGDGPPGPTEPVERFLVRRADGMTVAILAGSVGGGLGWLAWTGPADRRPSRSAWRSPASTAAPSTWPARSTTATPASAASSSTTCRCWPGASRQCAPTCASSAARPRSRPPASARTPCCRWRFGPWVGIVGFFAGSPARDRPGGLSPRWRRAGRSSAVRQPAPAAAARRTAFSHALSSWCDVVVMTLAAGRGVEQAMETAGRGRQGWAFAEIRGALPPATSGASRPGWRSSGWAPSWG